MIKKGKSYDVRFELKVVKVAKERSIDAIAQELRVGRKRIQEWLKEGSEPLQFRKEGKV